MLLYRSIGFVTHDVEHGLSILHEHDFPCVIPKWAAAMLFMRLTSVPWLLPIALVTLKAQT